MKEPSAELTEVPGRTTSPSFLKDLSILLPVVGHLYAKSSLALWQ